MSQGLIFQNVVDVNYSQQVKDVLLVGNESFAAVISSDAPVGSVNRLIKYDSIGEVVFQRIIPWSLYDIQMFLSSDGNLEGLEFRLDRPFLQL